MLLVGAVLLSAAIPMASVVAATALYMGGGGHPLSIPQDTTQYIASYVGQADARFVAPSGLCAGGHPGCTPVAVYTPEQSKLNGLRNMTFDESVAIGLANLDACLGGSLCTVTEQPYTTSGDQQLTDTSYIVFGYSQSAAIATFEKSWLIAHPPSGSVSFVLMANPSRPNGGILERFVGAYILIVGLTFIGATPTNSPEPHPLTTVDITRQYDPLSDFPTNPLNVLADLNVLAGALYIHPEPGYFAAGTLELQGQYQDTTYYLAPAATLPLLMPLAQLPLIGPTLAAALDPPLRVLIEAAYDRTINPGQPTPAKFLYIPNPIKTAIDFIVAIPTGWDDAIAYVTDNPVNRPFHTAPQPTYGVGGAPVYTGAVDPYGPPTPSAAEPVQPASTRAATTDQSRRTPALRRANIPKAANASDVRPSRIAGAVSTAHDHRLSDRPAGHAHRRPATPR
jgi:hypothetical protein